MSSTQEFRKSWSAVKLISEKRNGYLYFYMPDHPLAAQNGMVAAHRHVLSVYRGEWVTAKDIVFFKNGDRTDIRPDNLGVTTRQELARAIHGDKRIQKECLVCGHTFEIKASKSKRRKHCSKACATKAQERFSIDPDELAELVWQMPTTQIAKQYGVSDKAIQKRCKKHNIQKPPRGYWAKLQAGKVDPIVARQNATPSS